MYLYIANRVLLVVPTLVGAAALVFVLMRLILIAASMPVSGCGRAFRRSSRLLVEPHVG